MAENEKVTEAEVSAKETKVKDDKKKSSKASKPGFGAKILKFFKDFKGELKKIVWYDKKSTFRSTGIVVVCLIIVSAVVSFFDLGLSNLISWIGSLV